MAASWRLCLRLQQSALWLAEEPPGATRAQQQRQAEAKAGQGGRQRKQPEGRESVRRQRGAPEEAEGVQREERNMGRWPSCEAVGWQRRRPRKGHRAVQLQRKQQKRRETDFVVIGKSFERTRDPLNVLVCGAAWFKGRPRQQLRAVCTGRRRRTGPPHGYSIIARNTARERQAWRA
jgi:hypothetical protein